MSTGIKIVNFMCFLVGVAESLCTAMSRRRSIHSQLFGPCGAGWTRLLDKLHTLARSLKSVRLVMYHIGAKSYVVERYDRMS